MGCKYVKEFDFGPQKTHVKGYMRGGYAEGGSCNYAKGGKTVMEKETGEKYPSRKAMVKHEREETPRMQREEVIRQSEFRGRRMLPVASREPLIPMKKGGKMQAKIGKVMGEYKAGELHSGSAKGPVVKSRKQAVAIAMSEGRKAKR